MFILYRTFLDILVQFFTVVKMRIIFLIVLHILGSKWSFFGYNGHLEAQIVKMCDFDNGKKYGQKQFGTIRPECYFLFL